MPISGLLITLDRDPVRRAGAINAMKNHGSIELGREEGGRMAIVVDTPSSEADREVWDWLHAQPGISFVNVVYVDYEDHHPPPDSPMRTRRPRTSVRGR